MSYSIYYNSSFLKVVEDKYLPMFEGADSNVWSIENPNKRCKTWENTIFPNKEILLSEKELLDMLKEIKSELVSSYPMEYGDNCFGFFYGIGIKGKKPINTTFNDFKNLFKNGLKYAVTLNELKEMGVSLSAYKYNNGTRQQVNISNENDIITLYENKETVWFEYLNLSENKYNILKAIKDINKGTNKNYVIKTNLGYINHFNGLLPCFVESIDNALKVSNTASKWIVNGLLSIKGVNDLYSVGNKCVL